MQCANCGAEIAAKKRFCADCGTPAEDPETTRLARKAQFAIADMETDEPVIFVARPTLLFIKGGYVLAALGSIALAALLSWLPHYLFNYDLPVYVWLPLSLLTFLIPAYKHFKRNLVSYKLTASKIEIDEGFIARTTRNVPLSKVQDVTVTASLVQRLLGYGDVVIDNANEQGGKIILNDIQDPRRHADLLLRQLRR
jgi:membrane protein YdbS with pleckstrin-like domain